MKQLKTLLVAAVLAGSGSSAQAVQTQIMVQGYLTNASGTPYTTTQTAEFRLYQGGNVNIAGSGTLYYDETAGVTPSASGVFNYLLGSGSPTVPYLIVNGQTIPNVISATTFDTSQAVYLEISVGGTVLLPRLQLVGSPYAIIAGLAENLKPTNQITANYIQASSGTFTASGPNQASIQTSSGIVVQAGMVTAPAFNGTYYGNGAYLTGVNASSVPAANVTPGTFGAGVLLPTTQLVPGPITATSGMFTASGSTQPSIQTSSGIMVQAGVVTAPAFNGTYYGNGANLTGVGASNVAAANVTPGTFGAGVLLPAAQLAYGPITATSGTFTTAGSSPFQASAGGIGFYIDGGNNVGVMTQTPHANVEIGPQSNATLRIGGLYSGPTYGYSGNGQETSRHQLIFPSWSTVANNTLGSKIVSINKTAYGSAPWYLSQTSELRFFILTSGGLDPDDTVDALDLTAGGLMSLNGFYSPKGIIASSGTFTASGPNQASIQTSSGIVVLAGQVTAPAFNGTHYGDGSNLTGVNASNVAATNVTPGAFGAGVLLPAAQIVAGAVTVTSGTFTASGPNQASIQTSSGIVVLAGQVTAPAFNGAIAATNVTPGIFAAGVLLPATQVAPGPVTLTSGTFTASGPNQASIQTSSGIVVLAGQVTAPAFNGTHYGDGSNLTGVNASNVAAANVTPGTFGAGVLLPAAQIVAGAVTVTSGTFTASGPDQASIQTSSGIVVLDGQVTAPAFNGTHYGNGANLTGVNVPATGVTPGTFGAGVLLPAAQIVAGAVTVTSGTFTASGPNQASIQTSSGILVQAGMVTAPAFNGAFFGNGAGLTGLNIVAPPIGAIEAYAGQTEPANWIECNGRVLPQSGTSNASWGKFNTAPLFAVLSTVWGSPGAGQFNVPDFRGVFLRGWNHGTSVNTLAGDPDAAARVALNSSGVLGDAVGSYQSSMFAAHVHTTTFGGPIGAAMQPGGFGSPAANSVASATNSAGGSETRPKNASVMYIMRVQ